MLLLMLDKVSILKAMLYSTWLAPLDVVLLSELGRMDSFYPILMSLLAP